MYKRKLKNDTNVFVIGIGYVGLTLALALAKKGIRVIGIENSEEKLQDLRKGITGVHEPGIDSLLVDSLEKMTLQFHNSISRNLQNSSNIYIVTVGTPIAENRAPDMERVFEIADDLSPLILDNDLLILRSTLALGTSRMILERIKKKSGANFYFSFCPERTVEGKALDEIEKIPQIIGAADYQSAEVSRDFFQELCSEVILAPSLEAAELIKLINNTYRDLNFAFANEVAFICKSLNLNSKEVISLANHNYPRSKIALPGPVGGACLEKDPWILHYTLSLLGVDSTLARSSREINENLTYAFAVQSILKYKPAAKKICLLGLAFKGKPETLDLRGSPSLRVARELKNRLPGASLIGFEPVGKVDHTTLLQFEVTQVESMQEAIQDADAILVMNNSEKLIEEMNSFSIALNDKPIIIDFWGVLSDQSKLATLSLVKLSW